MSEERKVIISAGSLRLEAELNDSATARGIWDILPIRERGQRWGDEIYFPIPLKLKEENSRETVGMGDLAYWPPGNALCVFFGPTPMSQGSEIRPASAVNVFGRVLGDIQQLKQVSSGMEIATSSTSFVSTLSSAFPRRRICPVFRMASWIWVSWMNVPFVEFRSRTRRLSSVTMSSQWKLETVASGTRKSLVGFRPRLNRPLSSSSLPGWVMPDKMNRSIPLRIFPGVRLTVPKALCRTVSYFLPDGRSLMR